MLRFWMRNIGFRVRPAGLALGLWGLVTLGAPGVQAQPRLPGTTAAAGTASPDTLRLTLAQVQEQFLSRNFALLAQRLNVDLAQAAVRQAFLCDNPNLFALTNLYNPTSRKFFPFDIQSGFNAALVDANGVSTANTLNLQVTQLFSLTGIRRKAGAAAQASTEVARAQLDEALRQGRFQLSQTFFSVLAERRRLALLLSERQQLTRLLAGTREQLRLGTVPGFDVTRLELEMQTLETQRLDQLNQLSQDQSTLRVFLAAPGSTFIVPAGVPDLLDAPATLPSLVELQAQALIHRSDLQVAVRDTVYAVRNLTLQRATATPKLALGLSYANLGSAYNDFYGLQASVDLPVFNRNQGNIQAARFAAQQNGLLLRQARLQVQQDVAAAYEQLERARALRQSLTPEYLRRIQNVSRDATADFNRRLIGLVDFIDKIRAYKDAQLSLIDIGTRLQQAEQQLNFTTNTVVFP